MIIIAASCQKDLTFESHDMTSDDENSQLKISGQHLKIAVVSDIHYLDPSLLQNNAAQGLAFQTYLAQDPKLLEFSDPIFRTILSNLSRERPDILLIPGDLTKDGEKVSHETVASLLRQLAFNHIKVYVIPGNHDINNPSSEGYNGDNSYSVPTVSPAEFASVYDNFGYGDAIYTDHNSLSYICQPAKKLWILGIDACKYDENTVTPEVSGAIKPQTLQWIKERLAEAEKQHINVIALMHHGLIEHYNGQQQLDPGFVIDNWEETADMLIDAGLKVIFTGHYHANDITKREKGKNTLFDIETGSPVNNPSPYRIITLDGNSLDIETRQVSDINVSFPDGMDFVTYSTLFFQQHFDFYFKYFLMQAYLLNEETAEFIAPRFRNAIMAHYAGDERISMDESAEVKFINDYISPELAGALMTLWTDLAPADNNLRLNIHFATQGKEKQAAENEDIVYKQ
jgi:hypothetical protein